jgi:hypothetical protein
MAIVLGGTTVTGTQTLLASVLTGTASAINGSNITNISAGKVNQMVTMTSTSQTETTGTAFVDTNITASITPSATSSKILVLITDCVQFFHTNSHDDNGMSFRIKRTIGSTNTTLVQDSNAYEGFYSSKRGGTDHNRRQHMSWHYIDAAHNTTSEITYTHQFNVYRGNDNAKGRSIHDNTRGGMTLMEILA